MTPQRYCCTLQQSKRLTELGVDAPSMFSHYKTFRNEWSIAYSTGLGDESYPAYTVGELEEMIIDPNDDWFVSTNYNSHHGCWDNDFAIRSKEEESLGAPIFQAHDVNEFDTSAQARAAMLIYLLENNHITPSQVNNQLK